MTPGAPPEHPPDRPPAPPRPPHWLRTHGASALRAIGCYVAWFALSAFSLWILIELRVALLTIITYVRLQVIGVAVGESVSTRGQLHVADQWIVIVLAIGWLGFVVWLESYLRAGLQRGALAARVARIALWMVVLLGVAYGLEEVFTRL
ncbi:MAG: hypothetical protein ACTHNK_05640 [Thermomicrobiales bacterium]